jgi:Ion channel
VFLLMLTLVVFLVAAPSATWAGALGISIGSVALLVAGATAHAPWATRPAVARLLAVVSAIVVAGIITGLVPRSLIATYGAVIAGAVPLVIMGGLWRLLRDRGVTLQAVAGALVIYLSLGLAFAWLITLIAQISTTPYFAQHTNGTLGDRVYFSFTALTTTGFGDFSAGTPAGHALTVIEMLSGQLYLATVVGVMVGSYVGRRRSASR